MNPSREKPVKIPCNLQLYFPWIFSWEIQLKFPCKSRVNYLNFPWITWNLHQTWELPKDNVWLLLLGGVYFPWNSHVIPMVIPWVDLMRVSWSSKSSHGACTHVGVKGREWFPWRCILWPLWNQKYDLNVIEFAGILDSSIRMNSRDLTISICFVLSFGWHMLGLIPVEL